MGLWSANDEDYADGVEPTSWSGSRAIMQQYVRSKQPVKYAQCWVFGGTLTSGGSIQYIFHGFAAHLETVQKDLMHVHVHGMYVC